MTETPKKQTQSSHEFDRIKSVDFVCERVIEHLPKATEDSITYLKVNKEFVSQLSKKKDISAELSKYSFQQCPKCSEQLSKWTHKTKASYLISIGEIKSVIIPVQYCPKCNILLYPNLFDVGVIPLHNKEWIRFYSTNETSNFKYS